MAKLLGVVTKQDVEEKYLYNPYLFTAFLSIYLNKTSVAEKYLDIYNKYSRVNSHISKIDKFILKAICAGISKQDLLTYIDPVDVDGIIKQEIEKMYNIKQKGMFLPNCPRCNECHFIELCAYPLWKKIRNSINSLEKDCMAGEFEAFIKRYSIA